MKRRAFLQAACALPALAASTDSRFIAEAAFYEKLPYKKIKCKLCPRECAIDDRERGYCGVRENRNGTYYTLVHSRVAAAHIDPIEKKPFFHFHPGALAFSIGTAGCNVNCKMCQNWDISQSRPEQVRSLYLPPEQAVQAAKQSACPVIAYTYSEPVVFYEYMTAVAEAARAQGIKSVVVTGGFIQQEPLKKLCRLVDAVKIDLKAFSAQFYKDVVHGELRPVLDALVTLRRQGTWTEIVSLVIPGLNDTDKEFTGLSKWVKEELGPDVPVHFTQFHPEYLLKDLPPTPIATLDRARAAAAAEGLHYVYVGNVPGHPGENTYCPRCHKKVVGREGFSIAAIDIVKGSCRFCHQPIAGVWGT